MKRSFKRLLRWRTQPPTRQERLTERLRKLESFVLLLEEGAVYAEQEAELKKRIVAARARIRATKPPDALDRFAVAVSKVVGVQQRLSSSSVRILLVPMVIIVVLILVRSCTSD